MILTTIPKLIIKILSLGLLISFICIFVLVRSNKSLRDDKNRALDNVEVLQSEAKVYKTKDSLNAIEVYALRFTNSELKKYRSRDLELIKTLSIKGRQIESYSKAAIKSDYKIEADVVQRNDTLKCFTKKDKWYKINGCIYKDKFTGTFTSFDSLVYVESIKYKRFLGFLWKTKKIKDRKQDILSKNPNTKINNLEFIQVEQ